MNRRQWLLAAAVWVVALAAVALVVPVSIAQRPQPAAPGSAALSNQQLAEMLPGAGDFPAGWTLKAYPGYAENFGYWRYHRADDLGPTTPEECADVQFGASPDSSTAVDIAGAATASGYPGDVRLAIEREFQPAGFDEMIARVARCGEITSGPRLLRTREIVRIVTDSRPRGRPQLFRYTVTADYGDGQARIRHYAYARTGRLILTGECVDAERQLLDRLFAQTLGRMQATPG
ncbi:hypothetical protein KIH27_02780 [Mycobacterium sp. M1]|uniref:DUF5642 domain-containing protein n=1 Tax=Mycolicibacter acidiphilus TaxID=2835306 RepID=A0ABS5RFR2_9MYCO|nr:hypothetical protein [Mycolicibacter acidiphilus]MBS9532509.1 hypothetical protein [Mycolicibacter acidiphilus]